MPKFKFNRRHFLGGAGAALLPSLEIEREARGNEKPPKRFVVFSKSNGTLVEQFWPKTPGALPADLPELISPLKDIRSKVLVMGGLAMQSFIDDPHGQEGNGHHAYTGLLTGVKTVSGRPRKPDPMAVGGPSVDQYIADHIAKTDPTVRRSIEMGVLVAPGTNHMFRSSYRGTRNAPTPYADPWKLASELFAGGSSTTNPNADLVRQRTIRGSLLDFVSGDLDRLSKKLGKGDRQKIQGHMEAVRDLELQLDRLKDLQEMPREMVAGCDEVSLDAKVPFKANPWQEDYGIYPAVAKAHMDLMVHALKCDITRVGNILWHDSDGSKIVFKWLGKEFTQKGTKWDTANYHDITHFGHGAQAPLKRRAEKWYMEQFAYFLKALDSVQDTDGTTLLDNTIVLHADCMGDGQAHTVKALPLIIGGSGQGYFKQGQFVNFTEEIRYPIFRTKGNWQPHNRLLVNICQAMGLKNETFGDPMYGTALPELKA